MKTILFFSLFTFSALATNAEVIRTFLINKYDQNTYFVRMDSVQTSQTTILEYPEFLVLIELPFIDMGGNKNTNLYEDLNSARQFISFLESQFKNKPVKYVLSTHWHLHSLSSVTPFLNKGATLITASSNWRYSVENGFLGSLDAKKLTKQIIQLKRDTTLLAKTKFPIDVIFLDSTYIYKPTKDYLFFYFPKNRTLHASCMCTLSEVDLEKIRGFTYSDRLTDLNHAIASRKLPVDQIIKLGRFDQPKGKYLSPVFSYDYMGKYMNNGEPMHIAVESYSKLPIKELNENRHAILQDAVQRKISPQVINQAVYSLIKTQQFTNAIALAEILVLFRPNEVNYIDTLGEACFAAGDLTAAEYYQGVLLKINPKFEGGIKAWESNKRNGGY